MSAAYTNVAAGVAQLSIAGLVTAAAATTPLAGVTVSLSGGPASFRMALSVYAKQFAATWDAWPGRPDRTLTAADGAYRFLNLPAGDYTLSMTLVGYTPVIGVPVSVAASGSWAPHNAVNVRLEKQTG